MSIDVLAIGAHPDDAEIWCGGLLLKMKDRGYRTGIVHLTVGDMGSRGTPEVRRQELMAAANALRLRKGLMPREAATPRAGRC
jgi:N-acetylglucosamine malate deacetylase 1